jgi:hypothetical protein
VIVSDGADGKADKANPHLGVEAGRVGVVELDYHGALLSIRGGVVSEVITAYAVVEIADVVVEQEALGVYKMSTDINSQVACRRYRKTRWSTSADLDIVEELLHKGRDLKS